MFRSQSSDHHQGSITVLVQLLLISVHASSSSGMWLYVVCTSAYDVPVRVVSGCVQYITRHQADRYIVCTDVQTAYNHIPEDDGACMVISSNCTSTVIDP
jgi:hypothetical protein